MHLVRTTLFLVAPMTVNYNLMPIILSQMLPAQRHLRLLQLRASHLYTLRKVRGHLHHP